MPSFVFWNVKTFSRLPQIAQLAVNHDAHFVILAEGRDTTAEVLVSLRKTTGRLYHYAGAPDDRVRLFTRYGAALVRRLDPVLDDRVIVYRVACR